MAKKSSKTTAGNWLNGAEEVPREKVEANKQRANRQKFYRRFIIAAIILLPVSLGTNILSFGAANRPAVEVADTAEKATEGKAAAILAVRAWLASPRSPLAGGGSLVSWDGFDTVKKPTQTAEQKNRNPLPKYDIEIHHFTLADGLGVTYSSDLTVAVDPASGAHVQGTPSLLPVAAATDGGDTSGAGPWFGFGQQTTPPAVESAVAAWAKAFTSGDADSLRLAVGDKEATHTYVPLYNVAAHKVVIAYSSFLPDEGADPAKAVTEGDQMIAQVTFTFTWNGAAPLKDGEQAPTVTYDILVNDAMSASPVVVAWGGPGTAPELEIHGNALTGRAVTKAADVDPSKPNTNAPAGESGE